MRERLRNIHPGQMILHRVAEFRLKRSLKQFGARWVDEEGTQKFVEESMNMYRRGQKTPKE